MSNSTGWDNAGSSMCWFTTHSSTGLQHSCVLQTACVWLLSSAPVWLILIKHCFHSLFEKITRNSNSLYCYGTTKGSREACTVTGAHRCPSYCTLPWQTELCRGSSASISQAPGRQHPLFRTAPSVVTSDCVASTEASHLGSNSCIIPFSVRKPKICLKHRWLFPCHHLDPQLISSFPASFSLTVFPEWGRFCTFFFKRTELQTAKWGYFDCMWKCLTEARAAG